MAALEEHGEGGEVGGGEGAGQVLVVYFGVEGYVAAFSAGDVGYVEGVGESEG